MDKIVKVALEKVAFHVDIPYSYKIPAQFSGNIFLGQRVIIPFGRGNTKRQGIIVDVNPVSEKSSFKLKEIITIVDTEPIITDEMFRLLLWIKEQTFCTYYEAFSLMIPTGMSMKFSVKYLLSSEDFLIDCSKEELEIMQFLEKNGNQVEEKKLFQFLNISKENKDITNLIKNDIIIKKHIVTRNIQDDSVLKVELKKNRKVPEVTRKQQLVIDILENENNIAMKDLLYKSGVTKIVVENLYKKDIVNIYEKETFRKPYEYKKDVKDYDIILSSDQKKVSDGMSELLTSKSPEVALLFGITGSGKTLVYLELVRQTIEMGRKVIFLVPEISLTSQTINILQIYFGDKIAVLHSGLSLGERLDEYKRLQNGYASIVVGTRSAIFAPFDDIGLIIIDEEQEYTYKSEKSPRYHTRNIAKFRCNEHKALLVLGSATPSIESYYYAKKGLYKYFEMEKRFGDAILPQVYIVDMNDEKGEYGTNILSQKLEEEINSNIEKKEQTILLLNRRGFNTIVICNECREKIECPHCSIALTYHKANDKLMCHYCGYSTEIPEVCPKCHSANIKALGLGTQKLEESIEKKFSNAKVLRMDQDTTMAKFSHEEKLASFRSRKYDIMIGTQMVAKGLDFENVTLVGVLNADQSLYSTDFRAYEKTFSLVTQVVGRSGRGEKEGRAYIQTFTPFSEILGYAAVQDYKKFYDETIDMRQVMLYPPFSNFAVIGFSGFNQNKTFNAAMKFQEILKYNASKIENIPLRVLGPVPAYIEKIASKYRYKIIVKCINNKVSRDLFKKTIFKFNSALEARAISVFIDMDYHGNV